MPVSTIERPRLAPEMRDALKRHILRERQRKKDEADANEADKQRRRAEKAKALSSSKVQLEDTAKDIMELERTLADLEHQKTEQCNLLKRALTEEDRRKHSQQTVAKEPSWTSLYPTNSQIAAYAHHPQHYLSSQQSHRLLAYKPPSAQSQSQSFIPTTSSTNIGAKRARSPSSHIYSSSSNKPTRSNMIPSMHQRPVSPGPVYSSPSSQQVGRNGAPTFVSPQSQSAFSTYMNYMAPSSVSTNPSVSYPNQMSRARPPPSAAMSSTPNAYYLNPLAYLPQGMVDPKQQQQQQQANVYAHHQMLMPTKNGSIMNGYPIQPQS